MHQLERTLHIVAALAIVFSLASLARPFARSGFPSGHDATAHITYTFLFDRALSQGQVPVRWVEWARNGESQPLFNFYPPGLYYLTEAVHLVVPRLSSAFKSTTVLLWWAGGLFMFLWLRPLGWMPAGLAAVLFVWSPYVIVDAFVRAAYPELAAMAFAPGLLWSVDRLMRSARPVDALLVAAFVGAMLTFHLLSSLIFAPVVAAYAMLRLIQAPDALRRAGWLAAGAAIGVGLSAFYLLPSMAELDHVAIGRMTSGYSDYQQHFVAPSQWFSRRWGHGGSVAGTGDEMPLQIGTVQWLVIALAIGTLAFSMLGRRRTPHSACALRASTSALHATADKTADERAVLAFWVAMAGIAMFVMTDRSAFLWRTIPALPYLQFPWRYFMVISVATAALGGLLLALVGNRTLQALLVITVIGWQYQVHRSHLRPASEIPRHEMNIDNPRWSGTEPNGVGAFIERGFTPVAAEREAPDNIGRWTLLVGSGTVQERRMADHAMDLEIATTTGASVRINSHYFPGWSVVVDGQPADAAIDPVYGFMEVTVPSGTHRVEARFANTRVRALANTASVVSLIIAVVLAAVGRPLGLPALERRGGAA